MDSTPRCTTPVDPWQKQKKRAKAAADPACTDTVPPVALHIDYMSSECSTQGEDSDPEGTDEYTKAARARRWTEQIATKAAEAPAEQIEGKVWGKAQGEKVLEIRTPRWRSAAVRDALPGFWKLVVSSDGPVERDVLPVRSDSRGA